MKVAWCSTHLSVQSKSTQLFWLQGDVCNVGRFSILYCWSRIAIDVLWSCCCIPITDDLTRSAVFLLTWVHLSRIRWLSLLEYINTSRIRYPFWTSTCTLTVFVSMSMPLFFYVNFKFVLILRAICIYVPLNTIQTNIWTQAACSLAASTGCCFQEKPPEWLANQPMLIL
jgi:hypothetical protein